MNKNFSIVDPLTQEPLKIDLETCKILGLSEQYYGELKDGIPVVLPKSVNATSTVNKNQPQQFNYIEHYQKDAELFDYFETPDEITEGERTRLNEQIVDLLNPKEKTILDVGCGGGWLSKALPLDECELTSLDISHKNVRQTLKNRPHENHNGLVADVFNLPLENNAFDYIVASEIIEHLHKPKEFISKLLKVLKPEGKIIITTPYNEKIPLYLCVNCNCPTPRNAHLHSFNEKNIHSYIPEGANVEHFTLSNHYFFRFRVYHIMRSLSFRNWKLMDKSVNKLINRPSRFVLIITK